VRIRNCRDVRLVVPSLHVQVDPGQEEELPPGSPVPDGFKRVSAAAGNPPSAKRAPTEPAAAPATTPAEKEKESD
jgi:hypothetical protein